MFLGACGNKPESVAPPQGRAQVTAERLLDAANQPSDWLTYNGNYEEQRHSRLARVDTTNVKDLGLTWYADFDTRRGQESSPLVIDGVLYVTTAWSKLYAFDARNGQQLWKFDPQVPGEWAVNACCDVVNRGAAAWNGKIFIGAIDGRLIAVDAASGQKVWETQTTPRDKPYTITGAPRVVKGLVLIGQGGAEYSMRGFISAYDAETGKLVWRWYTVPGDPAKPFENPQMEMAAQTWTGEWYKEGGGGTVWDGITYDPQTGLLFVGVGNGGPWPAEIRDPGGKGDNLFLSSIVALKVETGEYVWHYQQVQRDSWDYTAVQQITVADLTIDGKQRHVVMQAPKSGHFYVLDAATGELISAKPIVPTLNWTTGIDMKTGRPVMNPAARYGLTGKGFIAVPHFGGAHNWPPMSYSPDTGLVYIPTNEFSYPFVAARNDDNGMGQKLSISFAESAAMSANPKNFHVNKSYLQAWDPVQQKSIWKAEVGGPQITSPAGRAGGALSTAGGLVFAGNSGTNEFNAFRADNGELLWTFAAQTGVMAGPVTYELDGEQYVAVVAGFGGNGANYYAPNYSRVLVFKLGGTARLPDAVTPPTPVLNPPPAFGGVETIAHGEQLYGRFCSTCHGGDGLSRGMFPDLRYAGTIQDEAAFRSVVIDGVRKANGMVSFASALQPADAEAVRAYIVSRAHAAKSAPLPAPPSGQHGG
ncbi:MAG: PQQ-dependent dehydrogenase, methanol/ethanol family [Steroidobacteraceae bacterium]